MYSGVLAATPPTVATWTRVYDVYLTLGVGTAVVVISALLYAVVRYRSRGQKEPVQGAKQHGWKAVLAIVLVMGVILAIAGSQTFAGFTNIEIPNSPGTVTVSVTGFRWGWNFTYPDGQYVIGDLTVPVNTIVILNITSSDVYHTFGIAMLDVKEDAIPGKVNQLWFNMTEMGNYTDAIRCYQLCGVGHAFMIANLTVVSQSQWNATFGAQKG